MLGVLLLLFMICICTVAIWSNEVIEPWIVQVSSVAVNVACSWVELGWVEFSIVAKEFEFSHLAHGTSVRIMKRPLVCSNDAAASAAPSACFCIESRLVWSVLVWSGLVSTFTNSFYWVISLSSGPQRHICK